MFPSMLRSFRPSSSVFVRGCVRFLPPVDQRNSVKTLATLQHAISLTLWLFSCMCNTWTAQEKGKEESFQAVYGNFSTGCSSTRFPQLRGPCWLTLGWLSSPSLHHCYSSVFPSDVLFRATSAPLLWYSERKASRLAPQKKHNLGSTVKRTICTTQKLLFPDPLSGRWVVTVGITWISLWKTTGTEVSSTSEPQSLCVSSLAHNTGYESLFLS